MKSLRADIDEIRRGLDAMFRTGDVIELRIPKSNGRSTSSGYFDDFDALAKALAAPYGNVPGVYYTLNPVKPALLARAANRVKEHAQTTTSDRDIALRLHILVDCDPVRETGISSSDIEHEAALERARYVRFALSAEGWPEPIFADSGNGAHLLYCIDLPNDEAAAKLIAAVLKALAARFNDAVVKVDETVFNAARIVKAYGTVTRKGDDVPERPHRLSRLLDVPNALVPVSRELLEEMAARAPRPEPSPNTGGRTGQFNLEAFLARHLSAREPAAHEGGRKWVLKECPFNADHKAPDAAIFQHADGSIGFKCFHNSCAAYGWREVRERFEGPRPNRAERAETRFSEESPDTAGTQPEWPLPLKAAAFYGVAGELVDIIKPHSEADPAAILAQFLVAIGSLIGRTPHFYAQGTRHSLNLFSVLVGATSRGRKGSSFDQVMLPLRLVDSVWSKKRVASGLSSGEGLIFRVRDPVEKEEPIKEKGRITGYRTVIADHGEDDKRLLVFEPEFARVLQVIEREANTLSPVIRQAWDSGKLGNLTKNSPLTSTGAHISIAAHITKAELDRLLTDTALANGFANRFLWICVKRSQLLPEGGELHRIDLSPLSKHLTAIVERARHMGELKRDPALRKQWADFYGRCARGGVGLFDAATNRAEAQNMRVASIYACLDQCETIRAPHLDAAQALWTFSEDSTRFLFGTKLGDPVADQILEALRNAAANGLTRSELHHIFQRHKDEVEIQRAIGFLLKLGFIRSEKQETGGRPVTRYFAL